MTTSGPVPKVPRPPGGVDAPRNVVTDEAISGARSASTSAGDLRSRRRSVLRVSLWRAARSAVVVLISVAPCARSCRRAGESLVFRQVISVRWAAGVTDVQKQGFRDALESLRAIPELEDMRWGDDAGHFDGNFDFVTVMDFADFESARRYVAHPLHQEYVKDHAQPAIGERVVVQHEW